MRCFALCLGKCVRSTKGHIQWNTYMKSHSSSCETDGEETIQKICFSFAFRHLHSLCISCMNTPEIMCAGLITPIRRRNFLGQGWPLAQEWPKRFLRFIKLISSQGWPENATSRPLIHFLQSSLQLYISVAMVGILGVIVGLVPLMWLSELNCQS